MTNSEYRKKKEHGRRTAEGERRHPRAGADGLLPADAKTTAKKEQTRAEEETITRKTGRGRPAIVVASGRNTCVNLKANGSRTSTRRVECETIAATFNSCSRTVSNCTGAPDGAPAVPPASAAPGSGHRPRRVRVRKKFRGKRGAREAISLRRGFEVFDKMLTLPPLTRGRIEQRGHKLRQ